MTRDDGSGCDLPDGGFLPFPDGGAMDAGATDAGLDGMAPEDGGQDAGGRDACPTCECSEGETRSCVGEIETGECSGGEQACVDGSWGECTGAVGPSAEMCDGLDNDCDTVVDGPAATAACPDVARAQTKACSVGNCVIVECDDGFRDCNGEYDDGCEADLSGSTSHCGACGASCDPGEACIDRVCSALPVHGWSREFGNASSDVAYGISGDGAGNFTAVGSFQTSINFGSRTFDAAGSNGIFVTSFADTGGQRWSRADAAGRANAVATDASGNVYVTGTVVGSGNLGGADLPSRGGFDVFVASYTAGGAHRWSARYGAGDTDEGLDIAVDETGNVYVVGAFRGNVSFGGATLEGGTGVPGHFVASFTDGGAHRWSFEVDAAPVGVVQDQTVDTVRAGGGRVFLGGTFSGRLTLGGSPLTYARCRDLYLAAFDAEDGAHVWSRSITNTGDCESVSGSDLAGSTWYVAGNVDGDATFDAGTVGSGGFLAAVSTDTGAISWVRALGGLSQTSVSATNEELVVSGRFGGRLTLDAFEANSRGGADVGMAGLSPVDGTVLWLGGFGGTGTDAADVAIVAPSRACLGGQAPNDADFGGGALTGAGGANVLFACFRTEP
ncbi:MAG: SBBP repeat-containing protein [Polyangiales bacterium]